MLRTGPFRIDLADERLWRGSEAIALRPKTWAVLRCLLARPGRLVAKQDLLDAVWGGVAVEEKVLNASIAEIRSALGDDARAPRYVETVPRRGFRFVAPLSAEGSPPRPTHETRTVPRGATGSGTPERRTPFVGRDDELARLAAACHELRTGGGGVVVVSGPAGIGKSRLVAELLASGAAPGELLVGRCLEGGPVPFWPWSEMLRGALHAHAAELVRERCGAAADELARVVPALGAPATFPAVGPSNDPELARLRLFDAIATFFERVPEEPPVLVVEDLHWADADSLRALQALAPRLVERPALLLVTVRDEEVEAESVAGQVLAALLRQPRAQACRLAGLAEAATRQLVDAVAPGSLPSRIAERIIAATQGNPFFVEEILRHLDELRLLQPDRGWRSRLLTDHLELPASVVDVFERRLRRLSPACLELLDLAAVAGDEVEEAVLAHALGGDPETLSEATAEAIAAGVLEETERRGRHRFRHALMRAVLQRRQPGPRRRRSHQRVAEALEALHGGDEQALPEIAFHAMEAVPTGDVRGALALAIRAAEQARAVLAYESEAEHYRRALALVTASSAADARSLHTELAVRHAEAVQRTGDAAAAASAFRAAAALARTHAEPQWLARAALGMTTIWEFDEPEARGCVEEALARLGDAPGHRALRTRLLARLAVALYPLAGTRARCEALCAEALAEARATGDPTLLGQTLVDWLAGQWYPDNLAAQQAIAEELLEVARRSGDAALRVTAHAWRAVIGLGAGGFDSAAREVDALVSLADEVRQPLYQWCGSYLRATLALLRGDLPLAERLSLDAFAVGRRCSPRAAEQVHAAQVLSLRREQDRAAELLPLMEHETYRGIGIRLWTLPYVLVEADRLDDARAAFDDACRRGFASLPGDNSRNRSLLSLGAMALACAALGDRASAAELYPLVARHAGRWSVSGFGNVCFGLMDSGAGALAACLGRWDVAASHLSYAIADYERVGAPVALARACQLKADMLLARGRAGDRARAPPLLDRAASLAEAHGLARVGKLVARLREAAPGTGRRLAKNL